MTKPKEHLKVITLDKVERKPTKYILEGFLPIPEGTVAMLSSEGGLGKTFLSIRLAAMYVQETNRKALCWFSEDAENIVAYRYDKLVKANLVSEFAQEKIEYVRAEPIQYATMDRGIFKANYDALADIKSHCLVNNIGFVVIDPLLAFYGGEENNNSQARVFMQPFLEWAKESGITIMFIHHASKGEGKTRGAGAFRDAVRTLYEARYIKDKDGNVDYDKKDKGLREVILSKDNLGVYIPFSKAHGAGYADLHVIPNFKETPVTVIRYEDKINDDFKL